MKSDTNIKIDKIYRNMLMAKSPEERFKMGLSMNDASRRIVLSTIEEKSNWRSIFFLKFYGSDFDEITKNKITEAIKIHSSLELN